MAQYSLCAESVVKHQANEQTIIMHQLCLSLLELWYWWLMWVTTVILLLLLFVIVTINTFSLIFLQSLTLLVVRQEGRPSCKKTGCWFVGGDIFTRALHVISPVVTTISVILSSNKIQNRDILVLANPGPHGKWPLKWRNFVIDIKSILGCLYGYIFVWNEMYLID